MVVRQTQFANVDQMSALLSDLENTALPMFENTLANSGIDANRRSLCSYSRFGTQLEVISLKYTLGYDLELIQTDCWKTPGFLEYHLDCRARPLDAGFSQCTLIIWSLSLCYLFDIELSEELIEKIPFVGQDMLVDRLVNCFKRSQLPTFKILFTRVYKPLLDALGRYEVDDRNGLFSGFYNRYFSGLRHYDASWNESHKEEDPAFFITMDIGFLN